MRRVKGIGIGIAALAALALCLPGPASASDGEAGLLTGVYRLAPATGVSDSQAEILNAAVDTAVEQNPEFALPAAVSPAWKKAPVVPEPGLFDRRLLKARIQEGQQQGLRPHVFAKVGDSNTEFAANFYGLACRQPVALDRSLDKTLASYNRARLANTRALPGCQPWTSFSRRSAAAQAGVYTTWSLVKGQDLPASGYWSNPPGCPPAETPLACEIEATSPRYALVMLGTNDIGMDLYFGIQPGSKIRSRLAKVLGALLARGVVPVLSTIPPIVSEEPLNQAVFDAGVARTNAGIWKLSRKFHLPMVNLWRSLKAPGVINDGLSTDGLHLGVFGAGGALPAVNPEPGTFLNSVDFSRDGLRFGSNRRNLILLKTLARLNRITG